jgi:sortase A
LKDCALALFVEGTADPGQVGNVVIVGHSSDFPWSTGQYKTIFALLDKLTIGDEITLPFGQNRYVYKITESKIVKPTNLTVLERTAAPTLTLISCYPVGTALNRIVVTATLVDGPIGGTQTTEPFLGEKLTTAR